MGQGSRLRFHLHMLSIESKQKQYKIAVMSDACVGNVFRLKGFRLGSRFIINGINGTRKIQRLLTRHFIDKSITQNLEKKGLLSSQDRTQAQMSMD